MRADTSNCLPAGIRAGGGGGAAVPRLSFPEGDVQAWGGDGGTPGCPQAEVARGDTPPMPTLIATLGENPTQPLWEQSFCSTEGATGSLG